MNTWYQDSAVGKNKIWCSKCEKMRVANCMKLEKVDTEPPTWIYVCHECRNT